MQSLDHHPCLQGAHLAGLDDDRTAGGYGRGQLEANEQRVAFHAVIRPATPTGSKVTVVLPQLRVSGSSWSAFSDARNALTPDSTMGLANWTTPPYSSTIAAVRSSMRAETALCSRRKIAGSFFLRCPAVSRKCALGRGDGAPRIFFVAQRDAGDHFAVGRPNNVHDFAAMGFNECPIDVVRRDCFDPSLSSFSLAIMCLLR